MEKLFGVLFSVYRGTQAHGEFVLTCLQGAWTRLLGDKLASVCRPSSFEGSTLSIEILDPEWEEPVKSIRAELVDKLRFATAGEIKKLKIVSRQSTAAN